MSARNEIIKKIEEAYEEYRDAFFFYKNLGDEAPFKNVGVSAMGPLEFRDNFLNELLFIELSILNTSDSSFHVAMLYREISGNINFKKDGLIELSKKNNVQQLLDGQRVPFVLELCIQKDVLLECFGISDEYISSNKILLIYKDIISLCDVDNNEYLSPIESGFQIQKEKYRSEIFTSYGTISLQDQNKLANNVVLLSRILFGYFQGLGKHSFFKKLDSPKDVYTTLDLFESSSDKDVLPLAKEYKNFISLFIARLMFYCDGVESFYYPRTARWCPRPFPQHCSLLVDKNVNNFMALIEEYERDTGSGSSILFVLYKLVATLTMCYGTLYFTGEGVEPKEIKISCLPELGEIKFVLNKLYKSAKNRDNKYAPSSFFESFQKSLVCNKKYLTCVDFSIFDDAKIVALLKRDINALVTKFAVYSYMERNDFSKIFAALENEINGIEQTYEDNNLKESFNLRTIPTSFVYSISKYGVQSRIFSSVYESVMRIITDYINFTNVDSIPLSSILSLDCYRHVSIIIESYNNYVKSNGFNSSQFIYSDFEQVNKYHSLGDKIDSFCSKFSIYFANNDNLPKIIVSILDSVTKNKCSEDIYKSLFDESQENMHKCVFLIPKLFFIEKTLQLLSQKTALGASGRAFLEDIFKLSLPKSIQSGNSGKLYVHSFKLLNGNLGNLDCVTTALVAYIDSELKTNAEYCKTLYFLTIELSELIKREFKDITTMDEISKFKKILKGNMEANINSQREIPVSFDFLEKRGIVRDEKKLEIALNKLNSLIGLQEVKDVINKKANEIISIDSALRCGKDICYNTSVSMIFVGNPGTGKTKVGEILAEIFYQLGIIDENKVKRVVRSDLVRRYVGHTEENTKKILEESAGGILFVDEAYQLIKNGEANDFGKEALETIMDAMEQFPEKYTIIFAGYEKEMNEVMDMNSGLKSRFRTIVHFSDYNNKECFEIFKSMFASDGHKYHFSKDIECAFNRAIDNERRTSVGVFGNARSVRTIYEKVNANFIQRCSIEGFDNNEISAVDFDEIMTGKESSKEKSFIHNEESLKEALTNLNSLVGLNSVKEAINEKYEVVRAIKEAEQAGVETGIDDFSISMVFTGNPGTGKTTVGELVAEIFYQLGYLQTNTVTRMVKNTVTSVYKGGAVENTKKLLQKSQGGILFIDEVYQFNDSDTNGTGKEVIEVIMDEMEKHPDKYTVIIAGYEKDVECFMSINPGLKSRFQEYINFDDYSNDECFDIFKSMLNKKNSTATISICGKNAFYQAVDKVRLDDGQNFGNARTVRNIYNKVSKAFLVRRAKSGFKSNEITEEDFKGLI